MVNRIVGVQRNMVTVSAERGVIEVIKTVIKLRVGTVMVFDEMGEQLPDYQGEYDVVRESILKDAPVDALFADGVTSAGELRITLREEW